jgi:phosphoribosylformylglycinamidine synthase
MVKKALVLKAPGTNNDYETHHVLKESGAAARIVHINELAQNIGMLKDYAILTIPGGFSYGDDLGAGKVYSLFLKYRLKDALADFIKQGKMVLGICNGFQVLVKSKLLPDIDNEQKATLGFNDSGRFICKWVKLKINKDLFWFNGMPEEIELPIAHAEGKFMVMEGVEKELLSNNQIALTYTDNPNGSICDIAGIVNKQGNVLGLMPHPDRFFSKYQHPECRNREVTPWGKIIFSNMVKNA